MSEIAREFPVMNKMHGTYGSVIDGCPESVPFALVKKHELQAQSNHGQTVERLAARGGLSPSELYGVLRGQRWSPVDNIDAVCYINMRVRLFKDPALASG